MGRGHSLAPSGEHLRADVVQVPAHGTDRVPHTARGGPEGRGSARAGGLAATGPRVNDRRNERRWPAAGRTVAPSGRCSRGRHRCRIRPGVPRYRGRTGQSAGTNRPPRRSPRSGAGSPANADRGGSAKRGRVESSPLKPASIPLSANATELWTSPNQTFASLLLGCAACAVRRVGRMARCLLCEQALFQRPPSEPGVPDFRAPGSPVTTA